MGPEGQRHLREQGGNPAQGSSPLFSCFQTFFLAHFLAAAAEEFDRFPPHGKKPSGTISEL